MKVRIVALLAEGVDRNQIGKINGTLVGVALLAEGVDRNEQQNDAVASRLLSPSSRRAWIEIARIMMFWSSARVALLAEGVDRNINIPPVACGGIVALLAEGVDRNRNRSRLLLTRLGSPSSRRAWIEITSGRCDTRLSSRSPSSRRAWIEITSGRCDTRLSSRSPSSRRAWIEIVL